MAGVAVRLASWGLFALLFIGSTAFTAPAKGTAQNQAPYGSGGSR